ncbi:hypothetical protein ES319_D08G000600v1 [Gossypium barbadense]|uniref:Tafazzin family protein n=1 Tax=Gossypium barbadense TaxID=3634 RepID=A0A5J5Q8L1_GOSBA|nr:hypothetical protein ES319_D08G000600v1 [Gossypium barbadense]
MLIPSFVLCVLDPLAYHSSLLDDPLLWGFKGFPSLDANLARWVLAAEDICFKNSVLTYFFRLGKCIPITRGAGIYQEYMNEALQCLNNGAWLHTFPEGKVSQEDAPIRRLKWGTASLIVRAHVTPIVLPMVHSGFEETNKQENCGWCPLHPIFRPICRSKVMPEKFFLDRRPPFPLCNKKIKIMIGQPLEFDIPKMTELAISKSSGDVFSSTTTSRGWPVISFYGLDLDEAAQRYLYSSISEEIQSAMEELRSSLK